jgi:hypothetical protein
MTKPKPAQKNLFASIPERAKERPRRKPPEPEEEETSRDSTPLSTDPHYACEHMKVLQDRVKYVLGTSHEWWSVQRLAPVVRGRQTSVSSTCRDLRKERCGRLDVERRRVTTKAPTEYRWLGGILPEQKPKPSATEKKRSLLIEFVGFMSIEYRWEPERREHCMALVDSYLSACLPKRSRRP